MNLRPYQKRLVEDWTKIIRKPVHTGNRHHHAYVQSPTGTGKTLIAFAIGAARRGKKAFITPRYTLNEQNREEGQDFDLASGFEFYTIQGLYHRLKREPIRIDDLFFDECHLYTSGDDLKMVSEIIEQVQPRTVTYISATTSGLNEDRIGPRHGYTAIYRYEDAYRDGFLHPVTLVRYNTSTNLKMKKLVASMNEKLDGQTTDDLNLEGLEDPEDQARWCRRHGIRAADLHALVWHRIEQMTDWYASTHLGEQAIFYVPWVSFLEKTLKRLQKRFMASGKRVSIRTIHGSQPSKTKQAVSNDFRDGKIDVVVACKMLREGFNHHGLALAYDCAYSPKDLRSMLQKIGRLTRRAKNKPTSLYHYAVDSHLVLAHKRQLLDRDLLIEEGGLSQEEEITQVSRDVRGDVVSLTGQADSDVFDLGMTGLDTTAESRSETITDSDGNTRGIAYAQAPLWWVEGDGSKERARIEFRSVLKNGMVDHDAEEKKRVLLEMCKSGKPKPERNSKDRYIRTLADMLSHYTTPSSQIYDESFTSTVISINPRWVGTMSSRLQSKILSLPLGSPRPSKVSPDPLTKQMGRVLQNCLKPRHRKYHQKFVDAVKTKFPHWFVDRGEETRLQILAMPVGSPRPSFRKGVTANERKLAGAIGMYSSPAHPSYRAAFHRAMKERHPSWFIPMHVQYKQQLLNMIRRGDKRPPLSTKLGNAFWRYTTSSHKDYDEEFHQEVMKLAPDWLQRRGTHDVDRLKTIIADADSWAEVKRKLSLSGGSSHGILKALSKEHSIDTSHFKKQPSEIKQSELLARYMDETYGRCWISSSQCVGVMNRPEWIWSKKNFDVAFRNSVVRAQFAEIRKVGHRTEYRVKKVSK